MKHVVLSPHHDDAVFSLGETMMQMIGLDEEVKVATVFGGIPEDPVGRKKATKLQEEHVAVMRAMRAQWVNGHWLDDVYPQENHRGLTRWILDRIDSADAVWVPAGIHHPDHLTVAARARHAFDMLARRPRLYVYEELPYRVLYPSHAVDRVASWAPTEEIVGHSHHVEAKRDLCVRYESQMGEDILRCLFVPERAWRVA